MSEQPEALRLASLLENKLGGTADDDIEQAAAELRRLHAENEALKSVMVAAAEEISSHWDAHCDSEGYGPVNLMRRLEQGIPSQYGYTAGEFERLRALNAAYAAGIAAEREACARDQERLVEFNSLLAKHHAALIEQQKPGPWPAKEVIDKAVAAEREACAQMCEAYMAEGIGREMARAIRARGEVETKTPDYLEKCPNCGGPADNGFDRSWPDPNPYYCTKCMEAGEY